MDIAVLWQKCVKTTQQSHDWVKKKKIILWERRLLNSKNTVQKKPQPKIQTGLHLWVTTASLGKLIPVWFSRVSVQELWWWILMKWVSVRLTVAGLGLVSPPRNRMHSSTRVVSYSESCARTLLVFSFFLWLCTRRSTLGIFLRRCVNRFPGYRIAEAGWWIEFVIWS